MPLAAKVEEAPWTPAWERAWEPRWPLVQGGRDNVVRGRGHTHGTGSRFNQLTSTPRHLSL